MAMLGHFCCFFFPPPVRLSLCRCSQTERNGLRGFPVFCSAGSCHEGMLIKTALASDFHPASIHPARKHLPEQGHQA